MGIIYFLHGTSGRPWGEKIERLAAVAQKTGWRIESPDQRHIDSADARAAHLIDLIRRHDEPVVLVGTSMGAYACAVASTHCHPQGLFLLTPALHMPGYAQAEPLPVSQHIHIVHGWQDEIVPINVVIDYARRSQAGLTIVNTTHEVNSQIDLIVGIFAVFVAQSIINSR